jgi:hypothetical protein
MVATFCRFHRGSRQASMPPGRTGAVRPVARFAGLLFSGVLPGQDINP